MNMDYRKYGNEGLCLHGDSKDQNQALSIKSVHPHLIFLFKIGILNM